MDTIAAQNGLCSDLQLPLVPGRGKKMAIGACIQDPANKAGRAVLSLQAGAPLMPKLSSWKGDQK